MQSSRLLLKKTVNYILFFLFLSFAFLQLNDPDPIIWITIYAFVAMISLLANFKKIPKTILIFFLVLILIYAAFHFSYLIDWFKTDHKEELFGEMVYDKPYLEGTREFLGLLLAFLTLFYQLKKPVKV